MTLAAVAPDVSLRFDVLGVHLCVSGGDSQIRDAVQRRLEHHRSSDEQPPSVTLDYRLERPPATEPSGRPVYESDLGTVTYREADDAIALNGTGFDFDCGCAAGAAVARIDPGTERRSWLASRPLLTLTLLETLKRRAVYPVHGAAVELNGRAVVLAGTSGAGKSTLAIGLALSGFTFLGDDLVLLRRSGTETVVSALCEELDLTQWTIDRFPALRAAAGTPEPGWSKLRISPASLFPQRIGSDARPGLILFPRHGQGGSLGVSPLSSAEAVLRLAPDVLLTDRAAVSAHLSAIGSLAEQSRCYELVVGKAGETSRLVRSLL